MLTYAKLKNKPRVFKSLIGISLSEFEELLPSFEQAWQDDIYRNYVTRNGRKRNHGGGRKAQLQDSRDKLLFILFYFRQYPTQEVQGFLFGIGQPQANEWVHRLTKILNQALGEEHQLPERNPRNLEQVLAEFADCPMIIEIKEIPAAAPLAEVVRRHGAQGRALFGSFLGGALKPFRAREFARAASRTESAIFWLASRMGIGAGSRAFEAFTVPVKHREVTVVDRRFVLAALRQGKPVHVWTVDDRAEAERLRSLGVEGIITNYPARMRGLCA